MVRLVVRGPVERAAEQSFVGGADFFYACVVANLPPATSAVELPDGVPADGAGVGGEGVVDDDSLPVHGDACACRLLIPARQSLRM